MLPFDVILFDVGGVLLTNGWDHGERARVIAQFDLDLAAFEARHMAPYDAWERSVIPLKAYLNATVFYEPRKFSQGEFFAAMCAQSHELPNGALGVLAELAGAGKYLVGALNNEARETNEYRFEKFGIRKLLDVSLSSCYLGLRKPELAIYKRALDILGKPADVPGGNAVGREIRQRALRSGGFGHQLGAPHLAQQAAAELRPHGLSRGPAQP